MKKKIFIFITLLFLASTAEAQTSSELLLTWKARNYAPPEYPGKHLATPGSILSVSAELISGGKFIDTRQSSFTWYVDGKLSQKGAGLKEISFPIQKSYGNEYTIRASARSGGKDITGTIRIPTFRPEIVLERRAPHTLRVLPYFFTIPSPESLRVSWALDDVSQKILSGAEDFLFSPVEFQGRGVRVSARAMNPARPTETREGVVRIDVR